MAVYVIATYDIVSPKGYESYVPGVLPLLQKYGAEILVADYEAEALEGRAPGVNVVLSSIPRRQPATGITTRPIAR